MRQGPEEHRLLTPGQAGLTLPSCSARASGSLPQAPAQQRPGPRVHRSLLVSLGHSSALPTSPSSPGPITQRCQSALGFESLTTLLTAGHGAWVPRVERAATSRTRPVPIPEPGPVHRATEPACFRDVPHPALQPVLSWGCRISGLKKASAPDKEWHHCPHEQSPPTRKGQALPSGGLRPSQPLTWEPVRGWAPPGWRREGGARCLLWAGTTPGTCPPG